MADQPAVGRETFGSVTLLTINRPERGNTLDGEVLDGLVRHTTEAARDHRVRGLVLTGAGEHFSLGGALSDFEEALSGGTRAAVAYCRERTTALATVILNLYDMPFPAIAALNGQAAGAGLSLALACDLRIAADRARLHFAYGSLGASTDGGMSWLLPRVIGPSRALALLLEQPVIRAPRALEEGLVTEVVPAADLRDRALRTATRLSQNARHSVTAAKRLVHASGPATLAEHMRDEHRTFAHGLITQDMRGALAARRNGDLPSFGAPQQEDPTR
jgi:2-(1,2-epoxy-1,2-dihydrophenyl)acetyl-CoA isomerase